MKKTQRGLTLIELMVTLVVLAIIVSIATTVPDILDKRRAIGAQEALYSEIQFARSEAIKQSRDIHVDVNDGAGWCMGVTDKPSCDCAATDATACTIRYGGSDVARVLDGSDFEGVSMNSNTGEMVFDSIRGMLKSGDGTIKLSTTGVNDLGVVISVMGRVRFCGEDGGYEACP